MPLGFVDFTTEYSFFNTSILWRNEKRTFVDVGGNIGLSTASFRQMGFKKNEILIFEPDKFLVNRYLKK